MSKGTFLGNIKDKLKAGRFTRFVVLMSLWTPNKAYTSTWCQVKDLVVTRSRHQVRCSKLFSELISQEQLTGRHACNALLGSINDPAGALMHLLTACMGSDARLIFVGERGPGKLLHVNDYNMDKAFVYAILLLSRLLGQAAFPSSFFDTWPPLGPNAAHSHVVPIENVEPQLRVSHSSSSRGPA